MIASPPLQLGDADVQPDAEPVSFTKTLLLDSVQSGGGPSKLTTCVTVTDEVLLVTVSETVYGVDEGAKACFGFVPLTLAEPSPKFQTNVWLPQAAKS